jgi:Ser/Thr protein kinase RdoA (MazF antagonist)
VPSISYELFVSGPLKALTESVPEQLSEDWERTQRLAERLWSDASAVIESKKRTVCHGDVHVRNLRFHGDTVSFFDFDLACRAHPVFDLATFLWSRVSVESEAFEDAEEQFEYLLDGYREVQPVSKEEEDAAYDLVPLRELLAAAQHLQQAKYVGYELFTEERVRIRLQFIQEWGERYCR